MPTKTALIALSYQWSCHTMAIFQSLMPVKPFWIVCRACQMDTANAIDMVVSWRAEVKAFAWPGGCQNDNKTSKKTHFANCRWTSSLFSFNFAQNLFWTVLVLRICWAYLRFIEYKSSSQTSFRARDNKKIWNVLAGDNNRSINYISFLYIARQSAHLTTFINRVLCAVVPFPIRKSGEAFERGRWSKAFKAIFLVLPSNAPYHFSARRRSGSGKGRFVTRVCWRVLLL